MSADEDIFPVWDFHEVAGMTAEIEIPLLTCDGKGGSDYDRWPKVMNYTKEVGGVSDGISGAAACAARPAFVCSYQWPIPENAVTHHVLDVLLDLGWQAPWCRIKR